MQKLNDLSRSLTALEPGSTLIAVIEMSLSSWLVAGIVCRFRREARARERHRHCSGG
jgi:transposase